MRELTDTAALDAFLAESGPLVDDVALRALTLSSPAVDGLLRRGARQLNLFGCRVEPADLGRLAAAGASVFSTFGALPFDPYRTDLYTPPELFAGFDATDPCSYCHTPDAEIYAYWRATGGPRATTLVDALARRMHDHSVSDALGRFLLTGERATHAVAVMGGHALGRDHPRYAELATLARTLTRRGFLMVSGGGPGAMEATHLGAWLAAAPDDRLATALGVLATAPRYDDERFVGAAFGVAAANPDVEPGVSLSIPTWLYGHEPPTIFATHVAKYFDNSVREDGLVSVARRGIVFAPGGAGTVQELFQDTAQNHYFALGEASPMVLLGVDFWTATTPAWPLLDAMRRDTEWGGLVALVDTPEDAIGHLLAHEPVPAARDPWDFCTAHCDGDLGGM